MTYKKFQEWWVGLSNEWQDIFNNILFERYNEMGIKETNYKRLIEIEDLNLMSKGLTEVRALKVFKNLKYLDVSFNAISSFENMKELTNLIDLRARNNLLRTISGINYYSKLEHLDIRNNQIKDIGFLWQSKEFRYLDISNNKLENIKILSYYSKLENLNISGNKIESLKPLYKLYNLKSLQADNIHLGELINLEGFKNNKLFYISNKI